MTWIVQNLWLIPTLPILAAGIGSLLKQRSRIPAASLAIGSIAISFLLALCAFAHALAHPAIQTFNFNWFQFGDQWLQLGWMLDPLTAVMLVMVTLVGLLIFIYSVGYMEHDENFTRFFCFLALFAGAMLGVVIANSLLLLFMCWEIVGLTSYLLIGFWYAKPEAAAAAKKAFIVTRIGDLGFLIGMVWLYAQTHTLLFYDGGAGCLESSALTHLVAQTTILGLTASAAIGILIFCGAAGKSGQVPLHVWLPDAMEGPTPVSALIHAATMVAAGVFLIARIYPLMSVQPSAHAAGLLTPTLYMRFLGRFNENFQKLLDHYERWVTRALARPGRTVAWISAGIVLVLAVIFPFVGTAYFPRTDPGQFVINVKAPSGSRIEVTNQYIARVENDIREVIGPRDLGMIVSNIGITPDLSAMYTSNSSMDTAFVLVSLKEDHKLGSYEYMGRVRRKLSEDLPELGTYFKAGGLVDAVINLGLPAPIDVQVRGNDLDGTYKVATNIAKQIRSRKGVSSVLIPQNLLYPGLQLNIDRERASLIGLSPKQVVDNVITALTSNGMIEPSFWIDPKTGNNYMLTVQYFDKQIQNMSMEDFKQIPLRAPGTKSY